MLHAPHVQVERYVDMHVSGFGFEDRLVDQQRCLSGTTEVRAMESSCWVNVTISLEADLQAADLW
jgi:hypothetical protein